MYCNKRFTDAMRPSRDHVLSITNGGGDWAMNIVIACRSCNSRRGDIPFRTYCKLLSPKQNERILNLIGRRLAATDFASLPDGAELCFAKGLALHDPRHWRFVDILPRLRRRCETPLRTSYFRELSLCFCGSTCAAREFIERFGHRYGASPKIGPHGIKLAVLKRLCSI